MVWYMYFIGVFIECWKNISTLEEKFRISKRPCNILYVQSREILQMLVLPRSRDGGYKMWVNLKTSVIFGDFMNRFNSMHYFNTWQVY